MGIVGIPGCFGFEQKVEGYQEFSHAGHKDFLGGFLCSVLLREPKGEGFDDEVVSHGGLGGQYKMLRTEARPPVMGVGLGGARCRR